MARQKRTIEEIAEALVMYAPDYSTVYDFSIGPAPTDTFQQWMSARREIRRLAARVRSSVQTMRPYGLLERTRLVHAKGTLLSVADMLIGLSNSIPPRNEKIMEAANQWRVDVETQLGIRTPSE